MSRSRKSRKIGSKRRRRKQKKKKNKKNSGLTKRKKKDPNTVMQQELEDEYELQKTYHSWYSTKFPHGISSGSAYVNMRNHHKRTAVLAKGYLTGYPDYVHHDPRVFINTKGPSIEITFVPGHFIEFKHPKGTGRVRAEQTQVMKALNRRGYTAFPTHNLKVAKLSTISHRNGYPYYRGSIKINKKTLEITLPRSTRHVDLPRRGIRKNKGKMKKRRYTTKKR